MEPARARPRVAERDPGREHVPAHIQSRMPRPDPPSADRSPHPQPPSRREAMSILRAPSFALFAAMATVSWPPMSLQEPLRPEPDMPVTAAARTEVIESVIRELKRAYVFPQVADEIETALRARMTNKEYDGIESSTALASALTEHLQA